MAIIANLIGNKTIRANYINITYSYVDQWQALGIAYNANPPHITLAYGMNNIYGVLYNLFGDRELGERPLYFLPFLE